MEFIYQIRLHSDGWDTFDRPVAAQGIVERDDKKAVIDWIEQNYPEYFDGGKVVQRLSKKSERIVYVSIYEIDDYWRNYWKQEVECIVCGKKLPLIDVKRHMGYFNLKTFTCSCECQTKHEENSSNDADTYWNDRCDFYFIYKISNKNNGKCYIGFTEREPIFRWFEHYRHSKQEFGRELQSIGIEHFTFEVLEKRNKKCSTIEEMHELETMYIRDYNSIENGYNCIVSKREGDNAGYDYACTLLD